MAQSINILFGNCMITAIIITMAKLYRNRGNGVILFLQGNVGYHYKGILRHLLREEREEGHSRWKEHNGQRHNDIERD